MEPAHSPVKPPVDFQLGEWLVQPGLGRISGVRGTVHLRPLLADLLMLLARNQGQVLSKEEIARTVWGRRYLSESSLTRVMAELRGLLGDDSHSPRFIETIPKRGYRLMTGSAAPAAETAGRGKLRLAALPFENLSGDPNREYFSDGMTEEMIGHLADLAPDRLAVIARTSSMHYKGSRKSIAEIGAELNLDYVLEGSVRQAGSRVRISAQLIRVNDQTHLWSKVYDSELRDVLSLQTEVAEAIAREMDISVPRLAKTAAVDPEVHDAYLRGLYNFSRLNPASLRTAAECFELAVSKNPTFMPALARLAGTYSYSGYFGYAPPREMFPKARTAAKRALELDDANPDAHHAMAFVHWWHDWDLATAERELKRGIALNPNFAPGHFGFALFLGSMKEDHVQAAAEAALARSLDPLSVGVRAGLGWLLYWSRQHERAIVHGRETLTMDANSPLAYYLIGHSATVSSKHEEAIAALEESAKRFGDPFSLSYLAMAYGFASASAKARGVIARLEAMAASRHVPPICLAWACLGLGDHEATIDYLEQAFAGHDAQVLWLRVSSVYDCLRAHPRFRRLLTRLPLPPRHTEECPDESGHGGPGGPRHGLRDVDA
jgi:TolB-like protein